MMNDDILREVLIYAYSLQYNLIEKNRPIRNNADNDLEIRNYALNASTGACWR